MATPRSTSRSSSRSPGQAQHSQPSDTELLAAFRADPSGDAFDALVRRHAGWVWGIARRRLRDRHLADDVTQAVFMLLARRAGSLHDGSRLAA